MPCPGEITEWLTLLRINPGEGEERWITVVEYGSRVASICWRTQQIIASDDMENLGRTLPALLEEVDTIEDEVLTWKHYHERPPAGPETAMRNIAIWNVYRTTRVKLLQFVLKLLNHVEHSSTVVTNVRSLEKRRFSCMLTIQTMFEEILDSVPTALEEPDSKPIGEALTHSRPLHWDDILRCLGSLKVVWFSDLALPQQRHLAYIGLQRCADEMGMRHAMVLPPYVEMSTETHILGCTRDNCLIHNRPTSEAISV